MTHPPAGPSPDSPPPGPSPKKVLLGQPDGGDDGMHPGPTPKPQAEPALTSA